MLCITEDDALALIPDGVDFAQAAASALGGLNAVHFLRKVVIQPGCKMLLVGAGGSIGVFLLQMAKQRGARVCAVDSSHKRAMLLGMGADSFVDYRHSEVPPPDERFDVIVSLVASSPYSKLMAALKPGGCYVLLNPRLWDMARAVFGSTFGDKSVVFEFAPESKNDLLELSALIADGVVSAKIDQLMPIEQIAQAHRRVESEQRLGAVLITLP